MLKQIEGSRAVAEAVAMCRPQVICAYPITPQTLIVEALSAMVKKDDLKAEFLNVESEFAAMSVAIGASAAGARAYTATASQGLLYMSEAVWNAAGLGLPIVMTVANRVIGAPINIWNDHSDAMSQRDAGWLQLYAETSQEALDLHIQAFRIAEELSVPVMVCMDGFLLTHASERADMGVAAALKATGRTDIRVVGQGGDGGTVDIGFACLSGMFERNDDVLYICYDNQAYMNTGVQRSGATPPAARTATTQAVGREPGNRFGQGKNVPLIAMAHEIPYVATATVADLRDLEYKATRAMDFHGARYLHVLVPCPLGWGSAPANTVKVARLATESGLFPVFEAEAGEVTSSTPIRRQVPVTDYLRLQARYAHLFRPVENTEVIGRIQASADRNIRRFGLMSSSAERAGSPAPAITSSPGREAP